MCYEKITVNELRDFIFKNYYKRIGFSEEKSSFNETSEEKRSTIVCNYIRENIPDLVMLKDILFKKKKHKISKMIKHNYSKTKSYRKLKHS